jgi:CheY-like chemotaxis protein
MPLPAVQASDSMSHEEGRGAILLVEDPIIRSFVHVLLRRNDWEVVEAEPGRAVSILERGTPDVSLVITNTPDRFEPFRYRIRMLYVAASPDPDIAERFPCCRMLQKPFHPKDLVAAVEELSHREL